MHLWDFDCACGTLTWRLIMRDQKLVWSYLGSMVPGYRFCVLKVECWKLTCNKVASNSIGTLLFKSLELDKRALYFGQVNLAYSHLYWLHICLHIYEIFTHKKRATLFLWNIWSRHRAGGRPCFSHMRFDWFPLIYSSFLLVFVGKGRRFFLSKYTWKFY